jgi:hypothetical protein
VTKYGEHIQLAKCYKSTNNSNFVLLTHVYKADSSTKLQLHDDVQASSIIHGIIFLGFLRVGLSLFDRVMVLRYFEFQNLISDCDFLKIIIRIILILIIEVIKLRLSTNDSAPLSVTSF